MRVDTSVDPELRFEPAREVAFEPYAEPNTDCAVEPGKNVESMSIDDELPRFRSGTVDGG